MRTRLLHVLALGCAVLSASPALAWDSICHQWSNPNARVSELRAHTDRGCSGPLAAHGRWRDPDFHLDEHRAVLKAAMQQAGMPADTYDTQVMSVFTLGGIVDAGKSRTTPTFLPQMLDQAVLQVESRAFAVDELAQLPDFSWSLADWASGNETCPIPELANQPPNLSSAIACHEFATHMGALNSSHFPPQSEHWFEYMHQLALQRADQCRLQRATAYTKAVESSGATVARALDARWTPIWRECETEALALEAVAQHYLQDSWSSGHMWQRWGSAKLSDFPLQDYSTDKAWKDASPALRMLVVAEIVALNAGTIHGSDPVSFEKVLVKEKYPLHPLGDAICYPQSTELSARAAPDGPLMSVGGDMHVHDVLGDSRTEAVFGITRQALHSSHSTTSSLPIMPVKALEKQGNLMMDCASGSVRQVYDRLADATTYGSQAFGAPLGSASAPPGPACRAPRVNNTTFARGFEPDVFKASIGEWFSGMPIKDIPSDIEGRSAFEYLRSGAIAQALARISPNGTEAANLQYPSLTWQEKICVTENDCYVVTHPEAAGTLTLLGVKPNGHYASGEASSPRPAPHADPPLPWGNAGDPSTLKDGTPEQYLASTFHRAHAPFWCSRFTGQKLEALRERVNMATGQARQAACSVCVEVTARHIQVAGQPSLCERLHPGSATFAAKEGNDPHSAAEDLCGCDLGLGALSNDGFRVLTEDKDKGEVSLLRGPVDVGRIPRDATVATRGRVFATNSDGQVVGLRVSYNNIQELDLDPATSATRKYVGSDIRGIAFTEQKGHDWLFVVDGATDTLHTFDLGTEYDERFQACSILDVGRDVSRAEGAYDIVVTADGTRAFVSLRGPANNPGDAIALVDLLDATTCVGPHRPVPHVSGFGGGSGLGALALSPDEALLAVAGRRRAFCLDHVYTNASGSSFEEVQVGCDDVWVLRTAQLAPGALPSSAIYPFGPRNTLPTRPVAYPYAVTWHPNGSNLAYASFSGPDNWPRYAPMATAGAVSLGSISPAQWSYNVALDGNVIGETVEFSQDGTRLYVGTLAGTLFMMPGTGGFWNQRSADPETNLHVASPSFGPWYGGCRNGGGCKDGWCPANCPTGATSDVKTFPVGSPIRKLLRL